MRKAIFGLTACLFVAGNLSISNAQAKDGENTEAIAGIIALGLLGAAVADYQHDEGHEEYTHHPKLHPDENAVGKCLHRAKKEVKNAGGHYTELNNVDKVKAKEDGKTVVVFHATGYYGFGHKESKIRCVIKDGKIVKFTHD